MKRKFELFKQVIKSCSFCKYTLGKTHLSLFNIGLKPGQFRRTRLIMYISYKLQVDVKQKRGLITLSFLNS